MNPFKKWCTASLALLLCLLVRDAFAQVERPAAVVYRLQGAATVTAPPGEPRALRLFDRLPAGAVLAAGPDTRLSLAFAKGRRYELGASSRVTVGPEDLAARSGPVLALPPVPPLPLLPPIAEDERPGSRAGAVRIRAERIGGLDPSQGAATLADATSLRFEPVEGAARYQVEVLDREGSAVFVTGTTNTAVDLPAGSLRPGTRYDWTVRTVDRVGPVARGEASFVTLPADLAAVLAAMEREPGEKGDTEERDRVERAVPPGPPRFYFQSPWRAKPAQ